MACVGRLSGLFVLQKSDFSRPDIYEWCAFLSSFSCKVRPRVWSNYRNFYNDRITVGQPMKRYQKILVRQNRAGRKAKQDAGRKAKQGRMQTPGLQAKIPFDGKRPKCRWKPFSLFEGTFLYCSIQSLKRGFWPVYGEAEGIMTYPYQKRQQKSALPALTGRFSVEQRGSWS